MLVIDQLDQKITELENNKLKIEKGFFLMNLHERLYREYRKKREEKSNQIFHNRQEKIDWERKNVLSNSFQWSWIGKVPPLKKIVTPSGIIISIEIIKFISTLKHESYLDYEVIGYFELKNDSIPNDFYDKILILAE